MAKRKRGKRGQFVKTSAAPRRRRRRSVRRNPPTAFAANPRRRRRRSVTRVASAPRRRRRHRRTGLRRNPPAFLSRGVVGGIVQGAKDGAAVVAGQVAARKIRGAVQGMLPSSVNVSAGMGQVGVTLGAASLVTFLTKYLPSTVRGYSRFIAAGAFSEAINTALAQTPIAPYLSAFPTRRVVRVGPGGVGGRAIAAANGGRVAAWPNGGRVGAYPMMRSAGV